MYRKLMLSNYLSSLRMVVTDAKLLRNRRLIAYSLGYFLVLNGLELIYENLEEPGDQSSVVEFGISVLIIVLFVGYYHLAGAAITKAGKDFELNRTHYFSGALIARSFITQLINLILLLMIMIAIGGPLKGTEFAKILSEEPGSEAIASSALFLASFLCLGLLLIVFPKQFFRSMPVSYHRFTVGDLTRAKLRQVAIPVVGLLGLATIVCSAAYILVCESGLPETMASVIAWLPIIIFGLFAAILMAAGAREIGLNDRVPDQDGQNELLEVASVQTSLGKVILPENGEHSPPKLQVWNTVWLAYVFVWRSKWIFIWLAFVPMLVYMIGDFVIGKYLSHRFFSELFGVSVAENFELVLYPSLALKSLLYILVTATFSMVWHRLFFIRNERKKFRSLFTLNRRQRKFWQAAITFGIVGICVTIPVYKAILPLIYSDELRELRHFFPDIQILNTAFLGGMLAASVSTLITGLVISRWILILPSIAVDDFLSFQQCWKLSKGNGLRIWAALALTTIPLQILTVFLTGWMAFEWHLPGYPILGKFFYFLVAAVGVSALSVVYSFMITRSECATETK